MLLFQLGAVHKLCQKLFIRLILLQLRVKLTLLSGVYSQTKSSRLSPFRVLPNSSGIHAVCHVCYVLVYDIIQPHDSKERCLRGNFLGHISKSVAGMPRGTAR